MASSSTTREGVEPDLLDSGEATDPTGRQYLRARWYDPTTGRFNRLDPFAGDTNEPQSLHKYLYAHADPIMGVDPTGYSYLSMAAGMGARASMRAYGAYNTASNIFDMVRQIREGASYRSLLTNMVTDAVFNYVGGKSLKFALKRFNLANQRVFRFADIEQHHLLPKQFADRFKRVGLDVNDFTTPLDKATHRLKPNGIHTGKGIENWNGAWDAFFRDHPEPSKAEILQHLSDLRDKFNI